MFYLKHKEEKLNIGDDNVFTTCPICGKEHAVDLHELLAGGEADLFGTDVYKRQASIFCAVSALTF